MNNNQPTAVIVIPTYNEADTIGKLIDHLFTHTFANINNWNCKLLIIDGNSPDNTAQIVREKQKRYSNLNLLIEKKKEGIGAAYVKGFHKAIAEHQADVIIEFDGDFQHPPETIPIMLKKIEEGADYVLGSRKIKGGSNPRGWGYKRLLYSELGGFLTRLILFFPTKTFFQITDPTTGLKASRVKDFVDKFDREYLYSNSFGYKLEFLYRMTKLNARIVEIPLKFQIRAAGKSKITTQTPKDIFRTALLLRLHDPVTKKFLKFAIVGFVGYIINAAALELFRNTQLSLIIANYFLKFSKLMRFTLLSSRSAWSAGLAAEIAIISNFLLNNFWTFSVDKIIAPCKFLYKLLQFNMTSFGAIIIQFVAIGTATLIFGDTLFVRGVSLISAIAFLIVPYNWIIYNRIIWKRRFK